ncbi:MAG: 2-hydroxyacyl-CoA dehydratase [Bacteroidales bacterium]|nr:2-hydroxyacyl-CoA dehydratase [Bacteroidales bacterium]
MNYKIGIDIGSTTAKIAVSDNNFNIVHSSYKRHNARVNDTLINLLKEAEKSTGINSGSFLITGSAGMGIAERSGLPFIQEIIASTSWCAFKFPEVRTIIDIGGEDSKMIFLHQNRPPDIRMNGNCAGGTGAFIDQMASLLGVELNEINNLVAKSTNIYPMASRCGVFAKTDIQNLVARKIPIPDILASVFHAVGIQILNTLSRSFDVEKKVLFTGGPFTFFPELIKSFCKNLNITENELAVSPNPELFSAKGAAFKSSEVFSFEDLLQKISQPINNQSESTRLTQLFVNQEDYNLWLNSRFTKNIFKVKPENYKDNTIFIGIDSGSTTTKFVALGENNELLFSDYRNNYGKPVLTLAEIYSEFSNFYKTNFAGKTIAMPVVTGYGENLIKAAFNIEHGIVETIAHYKAALSINSDVSFIMDIGGQDMKAIFIENGGIKKIEINEACSSGCGSFLETFGNNLGYEIEEFAQLACISQKPFDLGTRCTVFMNSKVKQALRENAEIEDIASGLSYSIIKNALYKVLKLHNPEILGNVIVAQGGTFKNPSVHKAFEILIGKKVLVSEFPELMGAVGAALTGKDKFQSAKQTYCFDIAEEHNKNFTTSTITCKGCENLCVVTCFNFSDNKKFYSGNKCEKVFGQKEKSSFIGSNIFDYKLEKLFNRKSIGKENAVLSIGIPRALNIYENFPFWHELFSKCKINVVLSSPSCTRIYEKGRGTVMSDSICFPAKLTNGHVVDLLEKEIDRIFYPIVVFEENFSKNSVNSYNCPIVTGYPDVIKSAVKLGIPFDNPSISFKNKKLLKKACWQYLRSLGIKKSVFTTAFQAATKAIENYRHEIKEEGKRIIKNAEKKGNLCVVIAGRPYHADSYINQKTPQILSELGADVISEDSLDDGFEFVASNLNVISQWAYPNRLYNAAYWVAAKPSNFQFVQLNSFGCGPDAITIDEINSILQTKGKNNTVLRVDEISGTGSLRLRLRSLIESLNIKSPTNDYTAEKAKNFELTDKHRTIIAPLFSDIYSRFLPPIFELAGYKLKNLPLPDKESVDYGLKYANNEICYPATIIIGDIMKFLEKGEYNPEEIAIGITQTGGQCRASSYLSLIRKAMVAGGYSHIPVISVSSGSGIINSQPGFKINWKRILKTAFISALFADSIAKMYYTNVVREKNKGESKKLLDKYISEAYNPIKNKNHKEIFSLLEQAVEEFNNIETLESNLPKIGIVGEIYVKYNSYGNLNIVNWLIEQKFEVIVPPLTDFFTQYFVNFSANRKENLSVAGISDLYLKLIEIKADGVIKKFEKINSKFKYYYPFHSIRKIAEKAEKIINLVNQYGEGWLIPAEIAGLAEEGVNNIVSLQPFGCIANQIISKGIEKRIRDLYPNVNLLFLDFEDGTSEVNLLNRLHFMKG